MSGDIRILLLADSHLGFDLPVRPRAGRRRRGYDFLANYSAALAPAFAGEVDLVVHAGDVFDRPTVVPTIAYQAYEPLRRIADLGVPVFIVPGNHERSRLPHARFASHPRVHVFDTPRSFEVRARGLTISLSGFPYERRDVRTGFTQLLDTAGYSDSRARVRLVCVHHCVEGATVGPGDFTFTTAGDVIRARDFPRHCTAVFSGHIHRHQVLTTDLARRRLGCPVLYPGSIERTSFAEMDEPKGFMVVRIRESEGDVDVSWDFRRLPARPMVREDLDVSGMTAPALASAIHAIIAAAPPDGVVSVRIAGDVRSEHWRVMSSARIRAIAPETMNVEIKPPIRFEPSPRVERQTAQLSFC
jgi:DNA repair protein SbcD/Mre11